MQNITKEVIIIILPHNALIKKNRHIIQGNEAIKSTEFQTGKTDITHTIKFQ
jgi:hypothetical protein